MVEKFKIVWLFGYFVLIFVLKGCVSSRVRGGEILVLRFVVLRWRWSWVSVGRVGVDNKELFCCLGVRWGDYWWFFFFYEVYGMEKMVVNKSLLIVVIVIL